MSTTVRSQITEPDKRLAVRKIMMGRSTVEREATKRHIADKEVIGWLQLPHLRGSLRFTDASTWRPKEISRNLKDKLAERVQRGESPAAIALEYPDLTARQIRDWSLGKDLQASLTRSAANGHTHHQEEPPAMASVSISPPPAVETVAPPPPAEARPERPEYVNGRHPLRDEAVAAFRAGMSAAEVIAALDLKISLDALWDWDAEDRANKREIPSYKGPSGGHNPAGKNGYRRFTPEQRYAIAKRWADGENIQQVASSAGCSTSAVQLWAKLHGLERSKERYGKKAEHPKKAESIRLYKEGLPVSLIAQRLGTPKTSISGWIHEIRLEDPALAATRVVPTKEQMIGMQYAQMITDRVGEQPAPQSSGALQQPPLAPPPEPPPVQPAPRIEIPRPTPPTPPAPAPSLAPPQRIVPGAPRKLLIVTKSVCPDCRTEVILPTPQPGMLKMRQAECPYCDALIEL